MWLNRKRHAPHARSWLLVGTLAVASVVSGVAVQQRLHSPAEPAPRQSDDPGPPGAIKTGVPAGIGLSSSGSITVSEPHTVIDRLDVLGPIRISADDVTIRRSRVRAASWVVITIDPGVRGASIEDVEVDGRGYRGMPGSVGISGAAAVTATEVHSVENGIIPGSGSVIRDSWIHGLKAPGPDPHYDGIQLDGGQHDVLIEHNVVDLTDQSATSTVMIDNDFGPVQGITVRDNRLLGGSFTVYADGKFSRQPITDVAYLDNRLTKGNYGYRLIRRASVVWSGNVDDSTGRLADVS